jgi:hypothetical protein
MRRLGFSRFSSPQRQMQQSGGFWILNGISQPIGLPQMNVAGGLNRPQTSRPDEATQPLCADVELAPRFAFIEVG